MSHLLSQTPSTWPKFSGAYYIHIAEIIFYSSTTVMVAYSHRRKRLTTSGTTDLDFCATILNKSLEVFLDDAIRVLARGSEMLDSLLPLLTNLIRKVHREWCFPLKNGHSAKFGVRATDEGESIYFV